MNTYETRNSDREKYRKDFAIEFLRDFMGDVSVHGYNPHSHIGLDCGVNPPRVLQIWYDKMASLHGFNKPEASFLLKRQAW